ncbi:MAG: lipoyl synthase [Syntrophales bacterium]
MMQEPKFETFARKPAWLRRGVPSGPAFTRQRSLLDAGRIHTVCQEARCPNCGECFAGGRATFLILGDRCTRGCRFCGVTTGEPEPPDPDESRRVAEAAAMMALGYVVVTSVARDDLADGGAAAFAETIRALRIRLPGARIEVLIPDFYGDAAALQRVLAERPEVLNHNLETVARLYPEVRPGAVYTRSLELLGRASRHDPAVAVKSGMMLGLGERPAEVEAALKDLLDAGCRILTLGQYLQPARGRLPVARYLAPEEFDAWRATALGMGFERVASGPFVRSSYHAEELSAPCTGGPG